MRNIIYRKFGINVVIIVLFLFLVSLTINSQSKILILEGKGIENQAEIGYSKKQIKEKYGNTDPFFHKHYLKKASSHPKNNFAAVEIEVSTISKSKRTLYYDSLELYFAIDKKGIVNKIYFETEKYITAKGLSIGDSRIRAYELYGKGDECQPRFRNSQEGIEIYFDLCNKVSRIVIFKPY